MNRQLRDTPEMALNIIVICGLPGVGKSALAEDVARHLRLPILSVDPIESAIIQSGFERCFETGLAAYLVAEKLAGEHLKLDMSVVIDAVSPVREAREMWRGLARKHSASLRVIECVLDRELHRQRVEARVRGLPGIPEVTWEDVELRRQEYLPWQEERLIVDTQQDRGANLRRALEYINPRSRDGI